MKRKIFLSIIFTFAIALTSCFAEDWDDFSGLDKAWDGQKSITNKEFEQAIDTLEAKQKKKEARQRKRLIRKIGGGGTSLHPDLNPDSDIKNLDPVKKNEDGLLLNIPVDLVINDTILEKGYYKVIAKRDDDKNIYLMFYQSQYFKGKVRASETNDDYEADNIDFVKLIPYNEQFVKIVVGCLDFNAYAFVQYKQCDEKYEN